jgi:hypothetical protein
MQKALHITIRIQPRTDREGVLSYRHLAKCCAVNQAETLYRLATTCSQLQVLGNLGHLHTSIHHACDALY